MTVHWKNTFQFTWWLLVRYRCCIVVVDAVAIENRKMRGHSLTRWRSTFPDFAHSVWLHGLLLETCGSSLPMGTWAQTPPPGTTVIRSPITLRSGISLLCTVCVESSFWSSPVVFARLHVHVLAQNERRRQKITHKRLQKITHKWRWLME